MLLEEERHKLVRNQILDSLRSRNLVVHLEGAEEPAAAAATELRLHRHQQQEVHHSHHNCHSPYLHSPMDVLTSHLDLESHSRPDHDHCDHAAMEQLPLWAGAAMASDHDLRP